MKYTENLPMTLPCKHLDYIVFVDESGDHGLNSIDGGYPLFVLAFCILRKEDYIQQLTPAFQSVKLKHFGHDNIILHERDIRKDTGYFSSLKTKEKKNQLMEDLTKIITETPFTLICCVIQKEDLISRYHEPDNPYHIALGFGLERIFYYLKSHGAIEGVTHIMVERRGKKKMMNLSLSSGAYAMAITICAQFFHLKSSFRIKKAIQRDCSWLIWWQGRLVFIYCGHNRLTEPMMCCGRSSTRARMVRFKDGGSSVFPEKQPAEKQKAPMHPPRPFADRESPIQKL